MRITQLRIENWQCFGGTHILDLDAKAYAVIAQHTRNAERSNWLGKSSLLEAIRFALYGEHRHRYEDDWITRGEKHGSVTLVLEDGNEIHRHRKRGSSTRLVAGGAGVATQEDAQQYITDLIGLTQRDFVATSYFEQRQMARFILQDSSERTKMVTSWFKLEPLEAAESEFKDALAKLTWEASSLRQRIEECNKTEAAEMIGYNSLDEVVAERDHNKQALEELRNSLDDLRHIEEENQSKRIEQARREQYGTIVAEGLKVRDEFDLLDEESITTAFEESDAMLKQARDLVSITSRELSQKRQLAAGEFSGRCPVADIDCPAKNSINQRRTENKKLLAKAQEDASTALAKEEIATRVHRSTSDQAKIFNGLQIKLETLRTQATALYDEPPEGDAGEVTNSLAHDIDVTQRLMQDRLIKASVYERIIANIEKLRTERVAYAESLTNIEKAISTEREGRIIVGKNGAQRRIAESALSEIEQGANFMLTECDIDLRVAVQWSREGKDLAGACEECGHPFPKTAKAKHCERCEAPRGLNQINRLEVILSDRSGAAEDLTGAAFQLSASSWMRHKRKARWSVAMLDEPFGQLDAANRRTFSTHLATLLRSRYGFEQSFCVAHHSAILDALPGRILITGDGQRSSMKVVA